MTATAFTFDDMAALAGAVGDFDAGKAAFAARDMAEAARQFGLCAALDPTNHEARYWQFSALSAGGHTEAAVDLARLAGLYPAGVICEVLNDDGTMARVPDLARFCQRHTLVMITVAELARYRLECDFAEALGVSDDTSPVRVCVSA